MSAVGEEESDDGLCVGFKKASRQSILPTIAVNGYYRQTKEISCRENKTPFMEEHSEKLPPVRPQRSRKTKRKVFEFFNNNKDYLEMYVMEEVPTGVLEKWIEKKKLTSFAEKSPRKYDFKKEYMDIVKSLSDSSNEMSVVCKIVEVTCTLLHLSSFRVYKVYPDQENYVEYCMLSDNKDPSVFRANTEDTKNILEVINNGFMLHNSKKLPKDICDTMEMKETDINNVVYYPILSADAKTIYVFEFWKSTKFNEQLLEKLSVGMFWSTLTLKNYSNLFSENKRENNMCKFVLEIVRDLYENMECLDKVIKTILKFAQKLVNADRTSLFLMNSTKSELVPYLFDITYESEQGSKEHKIHIPLNRGIAGHVATSGRTMNIPDAYIDSRFYSEIDELTGYKTKNILCMPVKVKEDIIGVVEMINKRGFGHFDKEDEVSFERFAPFFGLALKNAELYDKLKRQKQKYQITLELLFYHNTCKEHEVQEVLKDEEEFKISFLDDFYLDPYKFNDVKKCKAALTMFDDLFDISNFDKMSVLRFVLTVKRNYRAVPYHNFDHGWSVAHAMYVILKKDAKKRFDNNMRLALFVACLCHDLDHRGYTNQYLNQTESPLAAMYTTSPLEHHHFNITVKILQQEGHNIFHQYLSNADYHQVLTNIKYCILATDLSAFFPNLEKVKNVIAKDEIGNFNWDYTENIKLAMAISMTAADLSASSKPWNVQDKTVKVIFEEFYDQGDKERAAGREPIPMMDRNKPEEQAPSQIGFLKHICLPCYEVMYKLLPNTEPMYQMVLKNLKCWEIIAKSPINCTSAGEKSKELMDQNHEEKCLQTTGNVAASLDDLDLQYI